MKYSALKPIFKKSKTIYILDIDGVQWLSDGIGFYPLFGMPYFENEMIYPFLDIPEDQRAYYNVKSSSDHYGLDFKDHNPTDNLLDDELISFICNKRTFFTYSSSDRLLCLPANYLKPFSDLDNYEIYERTAPSGQKYFVVKEGLMIVGIIACVSFWKDKMFKAQLKKMVDLLDAEEELYDKAVD